jgi:hypothetical protein
MILLLRGNYVRKMPVGGLWDEMEREVDKTRSSISE